MISGVGLCDVILGADTDLTALAASLGLMKIDAEESMATMDNI